MSAPLISVIIPTFNRSYCLAETLDSVLRQSFKNYELIVVDDGSTDATPQLLDQYAGRLAHLQTSHAGPSAARNAGIGMARGDYIAFLDSDDLWAPRKLERQVDFFQKTLMPASARPKKYGSETAFGSIP